MDKKVAKFVFTVMVLASLVHGGFWAYANMKEGSGVVVAVILWVIGVFVSFFSYVNFPTNWLFGITIFEMVGDLVALLLFACVIATIVVWPVKLAGKIAKTRAGYAEAVALTMLVLLLPHLYMSAKLADFKQEFKHRARGPHGEVFYNPGEPGEFDYGGKLDEMVGARVRVLAQHQYLPYFTVAWRTNDLSTWTSGAYIYTFLPKSWYDGALYRIGALFARNQAEADESFRSYQEFLREPDPIFTKDIPEKTNRPARDILLPAPQVLAAVHSDGAVRPSVQRAMVRKAEAANPAVKAKPKPRAKKPVKGKKPAVKKTNPRRNRR